MVTIRPEMPGDEEAIRQVNLLAFGRDAEGKLVDLLRGSRFYVPGLSIVALDGEAIVGHILMSSAMLASSHEAMPLLTLAPMSVIPAYQRRGIGTKLVKSALKRAEGTKYPAVVVLGHPEYYPRFGEPLKRGYMRLSRYRMRFIWFWNLCPMCWIMSPARYAIHLVLTIFRASVRHLVLVFCTQLKETIMKTPETSGIMG